MISSQIATTQMYRSSLHNQSDNFSRHKNEVISFKGGLNARTINCINSVNVGEVEKSFANKGIIADFNGNKVAAACSEMTARIFEKLGLPIPPKIGATKFNEYKELIPNSNCLGVCYTVAGTHDLSPPKTVFFNTNYMENIDQWNSVKDNSVYDHYSSTDHFLGTFVHEFIHSAHFDNLYKKHGYDSGIKIISKLRNAKIDNLKPFFVNHVSKYSSTNLLELVAESRSKDITMALDENGTGLLFNPFIEAKRIHHSRLNEILKAAWNGVI